MTSRIIPIAPITRTIPLSGKVNFDGRHWIDSRGRPLRDLRISVTDRCNFRCRYCMPKEKFENNPRFLSHTEILSFEEIERLSKIFVSHGVEKIRLTGGEPLLRRGIENLIKKLSSLKTPDGKAVDIALTTNGSALTAKAEALKKAGLKRITVSLDTLNPSTYEELNDVKFPLKRTLDGIEAAISVGIPSVKINVVVKRGVNDQSFIDIAKHFRGTDVIVRFIEFMDVGTSNEWRLEDVVPSRELVKAISSEFPIEPLDPNYPGEVAVRWRYLDGSGEIGFISSITEPFCSQCSRLRLSVDGKVYKCLFATEGFDLKQMLRGGASDEEIAEAVGRIWSTRDEHYSEIRTQITADGLNRNKIEMSAIGG